MRQRQRSPILNLLQLAIFGFIFWQVSQGMSADPGGSPGAMFESTFRTMRLIFLGIIAIVALNILYPLAAWGIGRLRERQEIWSPEERFVVTESADGEPERQPRNCPNCGASLFDDATACPWCGHVLDASPSSG
jgi:hypothetical protein